MDILRKPRLASLSCPDNKFSYRGEKWATAGPNKLRTRRASFHYIPKRPKLSNPYKLVIVIPALCSRLSVMYNAPRCSPLVGSSSRCLRLPKPSRGPNSPAPPSVSHRRRSDMCSVIWYQSPALANRHLEYLVPCWHPSKLGRKQLRGCSCSCDWHLTLLSLCADAM